MIQSKQIDVYWAGRRDKVLVAAAFDSYLDSFAEEVGTWLTDDRCPFGVLLWPCARTLAQFLADVPTLDRNAPLRIADLGCGVGFISCVSARLFPQATVFACDYEAHLEEFVRGNAEAWGVADRVQFRRIDWRESPEADWAASFDWVVGTDVFYDDSHLLHVPPFAAALLKDQGRLTLADPKRYRFSKALELLDQRFRLDEHVEIPCSMQQDGIEEFMINNGVEEQLISILLLTKRPRAEQA